MIKQAFAEFDLNLPDSFFSIEWLQFQYHLIESSEVCGLKFSFDILV